MSVLATGKGQETKTSHVFDVFQAGWAEHVPLTTTFITQCSFCTMLLQLTKLIFSHVC